MVVAITAVICARLLRRGAWVCRTFRGPDDVASMVVPAIIGYAASICARSKAPRIIVVISSAAMLSVMSPWHGGGRGHISFIFIVLIGLMVVSYPRGLVFTVAQFGWLLASHVWRMSRLGDGTRIDHVVLFVIAIAQVCFTVSNPEPEDLQGHHTVVESTEGVQIKIGDRTAQHRRGEVAPEEPEVAPEDPRETLEV